MLTFLPLPFPPPPPVAQKVDNAIYLINLYPLDNVVDFHNTYLSESDLSSGQHYPTLEQPGPEQDSLSYLLKKTTRLSRHTIFQGQPTVTIF